MLAPITRTGFRPAPLAIGGARPGPSAPARGAVDVFEPASASSDGLKTYDGLTGVQRELIGVNGRAAYESLTPKERGVFLLLTSRLAAQGIDLSGMKLKGGLEGIHGSLTRFELVFDAASTKKLEAEVKQAIAEGRMYSEKPSSKFHSGMDSWGVREERSRFALQLGFGPDGAFVDMDRYNPTRGGRLNYYRHLLEIATPGNLDPAEAARGTGADIFSR